MGQVEQVTLVLQKTVMIRRSARRNMGLNFSFFFAEHQLGQLYGKTIVNF